MNALTLIIDNEYDIYRVTEWLATCVAKKIKRGITPDRKTLMRCSTMSSIIRMAKKQAKKYGDEFDNNDIAEARENHTDYVLELAYDIAKRL